MFDTIATSRENGSAVVVNLQNDGQWLPLNRQVAAPCNGVRGEVYTVLGTVSLFLCSISAGFHKLHKQTNVSQIAAHSTMQAWLQAW